MNTSTKISALLLLAIMLVSCLPEESRIYLEKANYNETYGILGIDYQNQPDTSLQQIILQSGVRKNGYGILLNVDYTLSEQSLRDLAYQFQLQDINALHSFQIQSGTTPNNHVLAAIEQARFIWIFSNNMYNLSGKECGPVVQAFHGATGNGGILVIDHKQTDHLVECLELN